jgi:VanZ like family
MTPPSSIPRHRRELLRDFVIAIFGMLAVLIATLSPFNFSIPNSFSLSEFFGNFDNTSFLQDQINNLLLFMPFGFGCATLLQRIRIKAVGKGLIVILLSAALSTTVEVLQVLLPSRTPTPADIINNTIGGFIGFICFYLWNAQSLTGTVTRLENSKASYSIKKITALFLGYILLTFLLSFFWQNTINLKNWQQNYPLSLGNEQTGDRPWQGYISELYIADRAMSRNEVSQVFANENYWNNIGDSLLASYQLKGKCCYQEQAGKLPELRWQGQPSDTQENKGIFLNSNHWLVTATPVTSLNKRISETSEFTISTTVATADTSQTGPARIISLSGNSLQRNLTLAQQGYSLDFRLRTLMTGQNGSDVKLNIPNIFVNDNPHHLVITYSKGNLFLYVDKLQNNYSLNLLELMPKEHKLFYYGMTFIPLGFGLAILTLLAKRRLMLYRLLLTLGILLPPIILEGILVSENGKNLSFKTMLLGVLLTAGTMVILRVRAVMLLKSMVKN